ncbi:restriction endonuclease subunit S [Sinorhizobium fredii]|uniref:restriction endonuclease subunit S n=1 Tax=Rhizobium fredii TaxID=380 RepID=UPI0035193DCC
MSNSVVHVPLESQTWQRQPAWVPLDNLCTGVFDCPHTTPKLTSDGPLVVRSQDIRSGVFRWHEAAHVSDETYIERIARAEPKFGDILYSREGTYFGIAAEMPANMRVCLGQRMVLIRPNPEQINFRFLRLWLNSPVLSRHIHGFRDGTVAERLNMPTIRGLPVPILPREEQDAIAELLGSLDDKIELNRQMNETLEAMAQAIFRDWFVDFGPTRRKQEGASDPVEIIGRLVTDAERAQLLADLFPARLGDNGLPEGWEEKPFGFLLGDTIGGDWGKEVPEGHDCHPVSIIRGTDFPEIAAGGVGKVPSRFTSSKKAERRKLAAWDVLVEVSGGSPTQPTGRSILITQSIIDRFQSDVVCASFCRRFRATDEEVAFLVYQHLTNLYAEGGTWKYQNQSTGISNFQTTHFLEAELVIWPGRPVVREFAELVRPLMELKNRNESTILSATRDLLLPKLMSGDIRLRDAEERLEAAQ